MCVYDNFFCISRQSCHQNPRFNTYLTRTRYSFLVFWSGIFSPASSSKCIFVYVIFVDLSKCGTKKPAETESAKRKASKTASFACLHPLSRELSPQTKLIFLLSSPFKRKNPWHAEAHGCSHAQNLCTGFSPFKKHGLFPNIFIPIFQVSYTTSFHPCNVQLLFQSQIIYLYWNQRVLYFF